MFLMRLNLPLWYLRWPVYDYQKCKPSPLQNFKNIFLRISKVRNIRNILKSPVKKLPGFLKKFAVFSSGYNVSTQGIYHISPGEKEEKEQREEEKREKGRKKGNGRKKVKLSTLKLSFSVIRSHLDYNLIE